MTAMRVERESAATRNRVQSKKPARQSPTAALIRPLKTSTVSIIGVGRLGTALALALAERGYTIEAIVARRRERARRVARLINPQHPHALSATQLDALPASELIFITTPDDAIAAVAAQLAAAHNHHNNGARLRTVLHMSGALSSNVLRPLRAAGFATASMHPLISISDDVRGAGSLGNAFYCVEGERQAVARARKIVRDLGAHCFSISTKKKALYHAAAVMASGHVVALFDVATQMLARCGLTGARARRVLLPLARSTIENLSMREPSRALTGSFARADTAVIREHLAALHDETDNDDLHDALAVYVLLGAHSLELARSTGVSAAVLNEIARALEEAKSRDK